MTDRLQQKAEQIVMEEWGRVYGMREHHVAQTHDERMVLAGLTAGEEKEMSQWRKKPVVIEAICWTGSNDDEAWKFCPNATIKQYGVEIRKFSIHTLEGTMEADPGDWIIRGIKGEFYPCKPDIFEATYESA